MNMLRKLLGLHSEDEGLEDKFLQAHEARVASEKELPRVKAEAAKLAELGKQNHFGEALMLGMKLRGGLQ
jgi:hypothetical protein